MKRCFKCGAVKSLSLFYKHKRMADGRLNKCKECTKIDVRTNRADNIDHYRDYDRHRYSVLNVRSSERYKYTVKYRRENPEKDRAHRMVGYYVRSGKIAKPDTCPVCGIDAPSHQMHAHHDDYDKPLDVRWMCVRCHAEEHPKF